MSSIATLKENAQAGTPINLFVFTLPDGTVLRYASVACTYASNTYTGRVLRSNLFDVSSYNEQGIDQIPKVEVVLADADAIITELNTTIGFKGANLLVATVFVQVPGSSATASDDIFVRFTGICDAPVSSTDTEMTISAMNRMNQQKVVLPPVISQRRCPWAFPDDADRRGDAAANRDSQFFFCGYSAGTVGAVTDASGLANPGTGYKVGDTLTLNDGGGHATAQFYVTAVNAGTGQIDGIVLKTSGYGYTNAGGPYSLTGGTGTGATLSPHSIAGQGRFSSGTTPFTSCDRTRAHCVARGMFSADDAAGDGTGNITAHFGGMEFVPDAILVRPFGVRGGQLSPVMPAEYGSFVPLVYGGGFNGGVWTVPILVASRNEGNNTQMDLVIGMGEYPQAPSQVVLSGQLVPALSTDIQRNNTQGAWWMPRLGSRIGWFDILSYKVAGFTYGTGGPPDERNVVPNNFLSNGSDDPEGNMGKVMVMVPTAVANGTAVPSILLQMYGRKIESFDQYGNSQGWNYSATAGFTNPVGSNPVWVVLDLLKSWGRYSLADLDLPTWNSTALYCDTNISVTNDLDGTTVSRPRFYTALSIGGRIPASEVIIGLRNSARLFFTYSPTGKLQINCEQAIAGQQPTLPLGSNAVATVNGGYPAYVFDDATSTILRNDDDSSSMLVYHRPIADTPTRVGFEYQNEFDPQQGGGGQKDMVMVVDVDEQVEVGQDVSTTEPVLGVPNTHQALRIANWKLSKNVAGNQYVKLDTSVRGCQLQVGQIVGVRSVRENWGQGGDDPRLFRVISLSPKTNSRRITLTLQFHDDAWYTDSTSQIPAIKVGGIYLVPRPPWPVSGNTININTSNPPGPMDNLDTNYGTSKETAIVATDGSTPTVQVLVHPVAGGRKLSTLTHVPQLGIQPTNNTAGGNIAGSQVLYYALAAQDSLGNVSLMSWTGRVTIPATTNTNKVTLTGIAVDGNAASVWIYRGLNPQTMLGTNVAVGSLGGSAGAYTFADDGTLTFNIRPLDYFLDHVVLKYRKVLATRALDASNSVALATIHTASTIGTAGLTMTVNAHANRVVEIVSGTGMGQIRVIASNTATVITTTTNWATTPDDTSVYIVHFRATTSSSTTIGDGTGTMPGSDALAGAVVRVTSGTGKGQERRVVSNSATTLTVDAAWDTTPDTTSQFLVSDAGWTSADKQTGSTVTPTPGGVDKIDFAMKMELPNQFGLVVDFVTIPQDAQDKEGLYSLSVVGRYGISGATGIPSPITGQTANESPAFTSDGTVRSEIIVAFTAPSPLGYWDHVEIWLKGYKGQTAPVNLAEFVTSPGAFPVDPTATQLSAAINNSVTTLPLISSQMFRVGSGISHVVMIGTEQILITALPDSISATVTRGYNGSTAASHSAGDIVAEIVDVYFVSVGKSGNRATVLTSPSVLALPLDGRDTAPSTPTGLSAQTAATIPAIGQGIILSWSPNLEADIDHYDVALRFDGTAADNTNVIATVPAGVRTSNKLQFNDYPSTRTGASGYATTATAKYYVRAVNITGIASAFAAFSAATQYAPDGSLDTAVTNSYYSAASNGAPPGPAFTSISLANTSSVSNPEFGGILHVSLDNSYFLTAGTPGSASPSSVINADGIAKIWFKVYYTLNTASSAPWGGGASGIITMSFPDDGVIPAAGISKTFDIPIENVVVYQVDFWFENWFGVGTAQSRVLTLVGGGVFTGFKAQSAGVAGVNFNVSQELGASRVKGHAGTNVRDGGSLWTEKTPISLSRADGCVLEVDGATADGDLFTTDSSKIYRLPIGTSGQSLVVDTGVAGKMKWAAASGTVTHTVGALTSGDPVVGNGGADIQTVSGLAASKINSGTFSTARIPDLSATYYAVASGLPAADLSGDIDENRMAANFGLAAGIWGGQGTAGAISVLDANGTSKHGLAFTDGILTFYSFTP